MTWPTKGHRRIVVGEGTYRYGVTGSDGFITLWVQLDGRGPGLCARFDYGETPGPKRAVTPAVVATVISWALEHGWDPDSTDRSEFVIQSAELRIILGEPPAVN